MKSIDNCLLTLYICVYMAIYSLQVLISLILQDHMASCPLHIQYLNMYVHIHEYLHKIYSSSLYISRNDQVYSPSKFRSCWNWKEEGSQLSPLLALLPKTFPNFRLVTQPTFTLRATIDCRWQPGSKRKL